MHESSFPELSAALGELGQFMGEEFLLDESGTCCFEFEGHLPIIVEGRDGGEAALGVLAVESRELSDSLIAGLLEYNWMGDRTDGGSVAINRQTGSVLVSFSLPVSEVTGSGLRNWMDRAIRVALRLREELAATDGPESEGADIALPHAHRTFA